MAATETILFRCGEGNCHARLDVIIPRARGVSVSLLSQRAEMAGWALAVVAVQHSTSGPTTPAIDLRCPACAAGTPALSPSPSTPEQ